MSRFDFNESGDFGRAVLGDLSSILQAFGGSDPSRWEIFEGSYNGVLFHVFESKSAYQGAVSQIQDSGGRRLAKYRFPYRDGQTTDDLGRKPEELSLNIVLHGPRYLQGLQQLIAEFNKPTPGDLLHPVRGKIRCKPETWQLVHSHDSRNAVGVQVTFTEHNFEIGDIRAAEDSTTKGALSDAVDMLGKISGVISTVQSTLSVVQNTRNLIVAKLTAYKEQYARILGRSNKVFNKGGSSADIPGLLPVNEGGAPEGGTFQTATSLDRLSDVPVQDIEESSQAVSVAATDLAKQVNEQRTAVAEIIDDLTEADAHTFYPQILTMRESAVVLQEVLERGVASSQAQVIDYTAPRLMSMREIAFANGIDIDRVNELDQLNPALPSLNFIEKGTVLKVPVA